MGPNFRREIVITDILVLDLLLAGIIICLDVNYDVQNYPLCELDYWWKSLCTEGLYNQPN